MHSSFPEQPTFTVFTPTYNRAHTLPRVYVSLQAQTYRKFEWLIVDDGSSDGTQALVQQWQKTAGFPIRYVYQDNAGKHIAHNRALREALGKFMVILDSDDACIPEALERLKYHWDTIPEEQKTKFFGVFTLCTDQTGCLVGDRFPADVLDSDLREVIYRLGIKGDKWFMGLTDIFRQYPFPEHIHRGGVPEGLVWLKIAHRYKARFVNEALRIYYIHYPTLMHEPTEYHARGKQLFHRAVLSDDLAYFRYVPFRFFLSAAQYARFSFFVGTGLVEQQRGLTHILAKLLHLMAWPLGLALFGLDEISKGRAFNYYLAWRTKLYRKPKTGALGDC